MKNGQTYLKYLYFKHTLKILHTARFFKYVWPFFSILHEIVKICFICQNVTFDVLMIHN